MFGTPAPTQQEQIVMRGLYESGLRVVDVAATTGFCASTVKKFLALGGCQIRKRGKRKGTGPVVSLDDEALVTHKKQWDLLETTAKGTIAENHVKTRLAELGFDVWEPFCQNHKTDLFILDGRQITRLQVKSATYDIKIKAFRANTTRHRRAANNKQRQSTAYSLEDVDFFIVYCGGMDSAPFYVLPVDLVIGRTDVKLYPHRDKAPNTRKGPDWERFKNSFDTLRGTHKLYV